jgi:glycogen operon protein
VPAELRGTYAGLGSTASIQYLQELGVTAVELLPVQEFVNDKILVDKGPNELLGLQHDRLLRALRRATPAAAAWASR